MTEIAIGIGIFLVTLTLMEGVAYLAHKYVMHGFLWSLHRSHHVPRTGAFEKNDLFAVMFAAPSILFIWLGVNVAWPFLWIGLGMTGYGLIYFLFHDVVVHQRIRFRRIPRSSYLRRIIQAHRIHHAVETKQGCVSFGFIYAPPVRDLKARLQTINPRAPASSTAPGADGL